MLLTFDDGYRDNHDVVAPALERHGAQGTFFVTSSYLTKRRIFWWDRIHRLLAESRREVVELTYPVTVTLRLGASLRESTGAAFGIVKNTYGLDLDRFLDHLAEAAGSGWSADIERRLADDVLMSWDQVRALRRAGHAVQSHTRDHRVLQTLTREQLPGELAGARADIERELGEPVTTIAYPIGEPISRLPDLRRAVSDAGYEVGFSNTTGVNVLGATWDPFDVKRMSVSRDMSSRRVREMLALPWLVSRAPLVHVDRPVTH
jgi:peptidoglycan/xylan/chitin deacetylase (PgdA/CDA1 family)